MVFPPGGNTSIGEAAVYPNPQSGKCMLNLSFQKE